MSLIWPASETDVVTSAPRLHAFIIGVGDYPHLGGGSGAPAVDALGLSQVTTPRFTAPAIAQWLLGSYVNTACPLGSIELLVSPATTIPVNGAPIQAAAATMNGVRAAFTQWFNRCGKRADNVTLFYFCGHGLARVNQYLLPEDFGDPAIPNRWQNCMDFDGLKVGMRSCAAQTQFFFVDACRETPFGVLTQLQVQGDPLVTSTFSDTVACSSAYYATTQGRQAFGPDNDVTYFGRAPLSCLKGVAAASKFGKWVVDTYSLSNALGQTMAAMARQHKLPLACNPDVAGMAPIHEPKGPRVLASVECTSDAANLAAEIVLRNGAVTIQSLAGEPKPLIEEVDAGDWDIEVRFPGGQFPPFTAREPLTPPVFAGVPVP